MEKVKKPLKILVLGDYLANTGYGRVMGALIPRIKKAFGNSGTHCGIMIDIVAVNWFGRSDTKTGKLETFYFEDKYTTVVSAKFSVPVLQTPEAVDDFGRNGFLWILKHSNDPEDEHEQKQKAPVMRGYDGIFIIQDAAVVNSMVPLLESIRAENQKNNLPNFKSIFYFPCDFAMVDAVVDKLNFFDTLITYNEYSRYAVTKLRPELKGKLKIIPHGIDTQQFRPIYSSAAIDFRKEYFGDNAEKYIVLNLNRNQPRKDIPCTIFGFQEFKKNNPDAFLYLHMNPSDPKGHDLRLVLLQTNMKEGIDFMFPPAQKENHGFTIEELNKIYNACDVYVTTTLGEGWGLGVTEAMACGLPVVCPMHTSFSEIGNFGKRVYPLENLYPICSISDSIIREQCDYLEVAEKLQQAKDEKGTEKQHEMVTDGIDYAESLHWDGIANKFVEYFRKTF